MKINSIRLILFLGLATVFSSFVNAQSLSNPYNLVGQKHNEYVRYVINNMATRPAQGTVVSTIEGLLNQVFEGPGNNPIYAIPEENSNADLRARIRTDLSAQMNQMYDQVAGFLATNPTVSQVNSYVAGLEATASTSVPQNELMPYLCFLATVKYSAQLWLPTNKGGENAFALFHFPVNTSGGTQAFGGPGDVILADAAGIVEGAGTAIIMGGAAALVPGPFGIPLAGWAGVFVGALHSVKTGLSLP